jgi:enoyl-CoA hydratase
MDYIQYSLVEDHIARLVVNRPEVRNALHWEAMEEFSHVIQSLEDDPEVRVLLISGAGKAFISGADLGLVSSLTTREEGERLSTVMGETLAEMRQLPIITIAEIDGPARGGGAEIAVSCDLRFMTASATIAFVQTSLGLIPGWGGAHRLFNLVGYAKGLEYLASARVISAEEAMQAGLVNGVFSDDEMRDGMLSTARQIAANSWEAVKAIKELYLHWEGSGAGHRRNEECERFLDLWERDERREIFLNLKGGTGKK